MWCTDVTGLYQDRNEETPLHLFRSSIDFSLSLSRSYCQIAFQADACFISTTSSCAVCCPGSRKTVRGLNAVDIKQLWIAHDDTTGRSSSAHYDKQRRLPVLLRWTVCLFSRSLHVEIRASSPACITSG